ncbi:MAG: hypothetical protein L0K70_02160 [Bifidobacterium crudilactis]|nr:hypothetical protein [Bifidobacterium crudilactis]
MTDQKPEVEKTATIDGTSQDAGAPWFRRKRFLLLAAVSVVVLVCGVGRFMAVDHSRSVALDDCTAGVARYAQAEARLHDARVGAAAAAQITASEVADPVVVQRLSESMGRKVDVVSLKCEPGYSSGRLHGNAGVLKSSASKVDALAQTVERQARDVMASREARTLADAKAELTQAVKDAQDVFDSTDEKVADNATRDRLREALDAANTVLADKSITDPQRYRDVQASLADPVNQVNESVNAKASDDQAAAAAAAQAKAQVQAPAQSQPRQRSSSGSGSGSSTPRKSTGSSGSSKRGGTGGNTAPDTGGGSSKPGTTGGNAGGGAASGGAGFDLNPSAPIQGCVDGKSLCPIG